MRQQQPYIPPWLVPAGFAFYLVVNVVSWRFPFFWDGLLTSTLVTWFYEHGWNGGIAPASMDAGHPPLFYAWLLGWWQLAGRSLTVSHLAMLPLLWIMYYQFVHVAWRLLHTQRAVVWASALFCLETTILAQSTQVSYDIALLAFYLTGLRYAMDRRPGAVALAVAALCLTSLRGVFAAAALLLTEWFMRPASERKPVLLLKYLPGLALFGAWAAWHFEQTGWAIFTPAEAWNDHRGLAAPRQWLANAAAVVRVHLEPGRLLLYLVVALGLVEWIWRRNPGQLRYLLLAAGIPLAVTAAALIPFTNPIGHRYFLIVFALSIPLLVRITADWPYGGALRVAVLAMLMSGHAWVWPPPLSNGWDAHLGHLPYFRAQASLDSYLRESGLRVDSLAAHFPLDVSGQQRLLKGDTLRPVAIETRGWNGLMLYSNINNDFGPADLERLRTGCTLVHEENRLGVHLGLYDCTNGSTSPGDSR